MWFCGIASSYILPSLPARCDEIGCLWLPEVLDGRFYALVVEPDGKLSIFVDYLSRPALPAVSECVFQRFPLKLVFGHFLDSPAGENDLPAARFLQPEKLPERLHSYVFEKLLHIINSIVPYRPNIVNIYIPLV
jgi:hypothetical protein